MAPLLDVAQDVMGGASFDRADVWKMLIGPLSAATRSTAQDSRCTPHSDGVAAAGCRLPTFTDPGRVTLVGGARKGC
jgi:hypothetical protein